METLIKPNDYTPEIIACIEQIKYRMEMTLTEFSDSDIIVFENDGSIYVLANPILGEEPIFDEIGNFVKMIPLHNLTIQMDENYLETKVVSGRLQFTGKTPRIRMMRSDLCMKIEPDNTTEAMVGL